MLRMIIIINGRDRIIGGMCWPSTIVRYPVGDVRYHRPKAPVEEEPGSQKKIKNRKEAQKIRRP